MSWMRIKLNIDMCMKVAMNINEREETQLGDAAQGNRLQIYVSGS